MTRGARGAALTLTLTLALTLAGCVNLFNGATTDAQWRGLTLTHAPGNPEAGDDITLRAEGGRATISYLTFFPGASGGGCEAPHAPQQCELTVSGGHVRGGQLIVYYAGTHTPEGDTGYGRAAASPPQRIPIPPQEGAAPDVTLTITPANPTLNDTIHIHVNVTPAQDAEVALAYKLFDARGGAGGGSLPPADPGTQTTPRDAPGTHALNLTRLMQQHAVPAHTAPPREEGTVLIITAAARNGEDGAVGFAEERVEWG